MNPQQKQSGLRLAEIVEGRLHLILNNTIAAVEDGRNETARFLAARKLDPQIEHRIEVLFEELVANTIRHGFRPSSEQSIHVTVQPRAGFIDLSFEDDGAPFDPLQAPAPDSFSTLENAKIGGLGIHLVVNFAAEIRYERCDPQPSLAGFTPSNRLFVSVAV